MDDLSGLFSIIGKAIAWLLRGLGWLAAGCMAVLGVLLIGWLMLRPDAPARETAALKEPYAGETYAYRPEIPPGAAPAPSNQDCGGPARFTEAAKANTLSSTTLIWSPFGPEEIGWETYAPLIGAEIATACGFAEPGFAAALAAWQRRNGFRDDGVLTPATFDAMRLRWHRRRPFSKVLPENCPPPPALDTLATAAPAESYGRTMLLRPGALSAYRQLLAAARVEAPEVFRDPNALKIFSAFRDPEADAARCERDGNCDGVRRTLCSAHRTGLAMDIWVGSAPGGDPASTAAFNRLYQSRTPAYRWMVRNAGRFGFVNYSYEPWHWEWTGEPI